MRFELNITFHYVSALLYFLQSYQNPDGMLQNHLYAVVPNPGYTLESLGHLLKNTNAQSLPEANSEFLGVRPNIIFLHIFLLENFSSL